MTHKNSFQSTEGNTGETPSDFLDSKKNNSNTQDQDTKVRHYCGRYILRGPRDEDGLYPVARIFCNCYGCGLCGVRKRWRMRRAIAAAMEEHHLHVFASLTIAPGVCAPKDSVKYIKGVWNKHRTYQRRYFGEGAAPSFISIVEFQKRTGNAHLHVLFSKYVPWDWLRESWQAVGGGIVDVRKADLGACRYMAKYLTKALEADIYGSFRRVSTSRDIKLSTKKSNPEYEFLKLEYDSLRRLFKKFITDTQTFGEVEVGFRSSQPIRIFEQ